VALAAQGLDKSRPAGTPTRQHIRRVINRLGLLQLDFVNVLVPAHYFVLFSRLGPYERAAFDRLVYNGREFIEHWAHEASIVPVECWPLLRYRREDYRPWPNSPIMKLKGRKRYLETALDVVKHSGPVVSGDLPPLPAPKGRPGDWTRSAHAHGIGTLHDLADYFRMSPREAAPRLEELVEEGRVHRIQVESWREPAFLHQQARVPRRLHACSLLSPFDPVVWFRPRGERLFGFHYRIEIYVPAARRKYGYYVLPFLLGDTIVARVDLKADRKNSSLLVLAAHVEERADEHRTAHALANELQTLAQWLGLEQVKVGRKGSLALALRKSVKE
jgi:hypothetical protein